LHESAVWLWNRIEWIINLKPIEIPIRIFKPGDLCPPGCGPNAWIIVVLKFESKSGSLWFFCLLFEKELILTNVEYPGKISGIFTFEAIIILAIVFFGLLFYNNSFSNTNELKKKPVSTNISVSDNNAVSGPCIRLQVFSEDMDIK